MLLFSRFLLIAALMRFRYVRQIGNPRQFRLAPDRVEAEPERGEAKLIGARRNPIAPGPIPAGKSLPWRWFPASMPG